jgi:peptidoglycan hydrolase-like protein with peptidoglycan-binding domain
LFATRAFETFMDPQRAFEQAQPQTTIRIERAEPEVRRPLADPVVQKVQSVLKGLGFYAGDVDGLKGPGTEKAVRAYQDKMGLETTGRIDQQLLEALGEDDTTGAISGPAPGAPQATPGGNDALIKDIQLGLRAFGNADIVVDGIAGARTRSAIMEFQSLFGLPEDGEPTRAVREKMREAKLLQ